MWAKKFNSTEWPFFDVAALVDPSVRADEEVLAKLDKGLPIFLSLPTIRFCERALHFATLKRAGKAPSELPDPFEPLIVLFERGSLFSSEGSGYIDVDGLGIRRGRFVDYLQDEPRAPVDREQLNDLDWRVLADRLAKEIAGLDSGIEITLSASSGADHRQYVLLSREERELAVVLVEDDSAAARVSESLSEGMQESWAASWRHVDAPDGHNKLECRMTWPPSDGQLKQLVDTLVHALRRGFGLDETGNLCYEALQRESGKAIWLPRLGLTPQRTTRAKQP
ncbi:hypothetical protein Arub01_30430 [Actinomadura rubrobrunea]|uniref:TY-Chap N-terminal domain-containing protein n=1 Tax=Actinomadura rubrobrunea TaxID=115335 RepID=A0A9W6PUL6_9ACTN|nr:hypothetical protein Arub01_30430 [Actinomadura rubrobrunea]